MKILEISITDLFGARSFEINLRKNKHLILTGINGSGKTLILKSIYSIFNLNHLFFLQAPYREFCITVNSETKEDLEETIKVTIEKGIGYTIEYGKIKYNFKLKIDSDLADLIPERTLAELISNNNLENSIDFALADIQDHPKLRIPDKIRARRAIKSIESEDLYESEIENFQAMMESDIQVQFIQDQRLINERENKRLNNSSNIDRKAIELRNLIRHALVQSGQHANNSTDIISNIIEALKDNAVSENDVINSISKYNSKVKSLTELGILSKNYSRNGFNINKSDYLAAGKENPHILSAINEIAVDAYDGLSHFNQLEIQLKKFSKFINSKFTNKKIVFSPSFGFNVLTNRGEEINPARLSSGEQQLIIVAFDIIFGSSQENYSQMRIPLQSDSTPQPSRIILIDEPEISLHIKWQKDLIKDLQKLSEGSQTQLIIATHSPSIVASNLDLEFSVPINEE